MPFSCFILLLSTQPQIYKENRRPMKKRRPMKIWDFDTHIEDIIYREVNGYIYICTTQK